MTLNLTRIYKQKLSWYLFKGVRNIFPFWPLLQISNMKTLPLKSLSWNFPTASADLFPMTHILLQFLLQRVGKKTFESDVCTNQTGLKTTFEQDKLLKVFVCRNNCCWTNTTSFYTWQYLLCYSLTRIGIASHIMIKGSWRISEYKISSLRGKIFGKRFGQSSLAISGILLMYKWDNWATVT